MANKAQIKDEHKGRVVAFGKSGKKLGERDDLDELAIIAHESQNPKLLDLFVKPMPTLEELKKAGVDVKLAAKPVVQGTDTENKTAGGQIAGQ